VMKLCCMLHFRITIDSKFGRVYTICDPSELDREKKQTYYFTVEGRNGGFSTSISLVVSLLDRNDNAPVFIYDSYDVHISENAWQFSIYPFRIMVNIV